MNNINVTFVLLPCIGAVLAAFLLRDWRLAGAVAAGGLGLLLVLPGAGNVATIFVLPLVAGAAIAGLVLLPFLWRVKNSTIWGRMTVALIGALFAAYANLLIFSGTL